jgi:2-oxoglutarate dehydrogenase complex dehydrogenase (E1) component-like enzyme
MVSFCVPLLWIKLDAHTRLCVRGSLPNARRFVWLQEEPLNGGAWAFVSPHIQRVLLGLRGAEAPRLMYVGRPSLPTPAVGLSQANTAQARALLDDLLEAIRAP